MKDWRISMWSLKQCQLHNQQINFWIIVEKVKNPIHAVANVDDYGASARLLAATTLRCESEQDVVDDDDDGDDDGDDIYIIMKCLSVCVSRKMITSSWESPVTTWTPHNHPVQLQVSFDGSRLVFHGSMSVL